MPSRRDSKPSTPPIPEELECLYSDTMRAIRNQVAHPEVPKNMEAEIVYTARMLIDRIARLEADATALFEHIAEVTDELARLGEEKRLLRGALEAWVKSDSMENKNRAHHALDATRTN